VEKKGIVNLSYFWFLPGLRSHKKNGVHGDLPSEQSSQAPIGGRRCRRLPRANKFCRQTGDAIANDHQVARHCLSSGHSDEVDGGVRRERWLDFEVAGLSYKDACRNAA